MAAYLDYKLNIPRPNAGFGEQESMGPPTTSSHVFVYSSCQKQPPQGLVHRSLTITTQSSTGFIYGPGMHSSGVISTSTRLIQKKLFLSPCLGSIIVLLLLNRFSSCFLVLLRRTGLLKCSKFSYLLSSIECTYRVFSLMAWEGNAVRV